MNTLFFPAISAQGNYCIRVFDDFQAGADHAGLKRLSEIIIQHPGMPLEKVGFLALEKADN